MGAENPNFKNGDQAPNPDADKWDSLYNELEKRIDDNFLDDQEFIEGKAKKTPIEYSEEDAKKDLESAKASHDEKIEQIDNLKKELERIYDRTEEEYDKEHNEDFAGETNKNSKTGKERTYNDFDLYSQESGEERKRRHDLSVISEHLSKLPDESAEDYSKRVAKLYEDFPRKEDESLKDYRERIDEADKNSEILEKNASYLLDPEGEAKKWLEEELKNVDEWQNNGRIDDEKARNFRQELYNKAIAKQLESNQTKVKEEKLQALRDAKAEASAEDQKTSESDDNPGLLTKEEIDALLSQRESNSSNQTKTQEIEANKEMEIQKAKEELYQISQELMEIEKQQNGQELYDTAQDLMEIDVERAKDELYNVTQELMELESSTKNRPLVAMNIDWSHDQRELAHDLAEDSLNAEVSGAKGVKGIIKRIWKGNLFKKYYEQKYTKEFEAGKRTDKDGRTVQDLIKDQAPDVMERFILGATEDLSYIHQHIGNKRNENGEYIDGEKLKKADKFTTALIRQAIVDYARKSLEPGQKLSDLDREFRNETRRIMEEAFEDNRISKGFKNTNFLTTAKEAARRYEEIAANAKDKAEQDKAMAEVMAGFQLYNAEVRSNVRTEAHRDNIDKITNWFESKASFIPSEVIAGAAGAALALTQTGARAIAGAAGGIIASSAITGLRERNRITEDRARMMRDLANGMEYNGAGKKYEAKIGGTIYDMQTAGSLTANLENALNSEGENRSEDILRAIAEARVRIDLSDSEQKDLISYSSADKRGKERLNLDMAVIRAEKSLSREDLKTLDIIKDEIRSQIVKGDGGLEEKDKDFKRYRAFTAAKKAGKTLVLGAAIFAGSQEVMAALDPSKIGIFEKAGLLKTENNLDAKETLLAKGVDKIRGVKDSYTIPGETTSYTDIHENISDPDQIARYEANGYTKVETTPGWSEPNDKIVAVDPSASTAKVDVAYDGWANNGTKFSDGNELRAYIENGKFISGMKGNSTLNGQNINYDTSNIKAFLTIGDSKFEIAGSLNEKGQLTWGENGVFTTTTGETIKAIGDNGEKLYKYFEIAADNGVDADGVQHIIPFATDVGANTFSGKIEQVVTETIEHPAVYSFSKVISDTGPATEVIRDTTFNGVGFAPILGRRGLGGAAAPEPEAAGTAPEVPAEAPEPAEQPEAQAETPLEASPEAPEVASDIETPSDTTNAPEAPEAASNTEAPSDTANIINAPEELKDFVADYEKAISERRNSIGDVVYHFLTSDDDPTEENQAKINDAIQSLTPDGKIALKEILAIRNNLPEEDRYKLRFGNALGGYLALNQNVLDQ